MRSAGALTMGVAAWVAFAPASLAASAADKTNIVRGGAFYSYPTGDLPTTVIVETGERVRATIKAHEEGGLYVSYERKLSSLMGLNLDLSYVRYNVDLKVADTALTL